MEKDFRDSRMLSEEIKALKLLLIVFYVTFLGFDIFLYFIYKSVSLRSAIISYPLASIWYYLVNVFLLPISLFLIKKHSAYFVKYFVFFCFTISDFAYLVYTTLPLENHTVAGNFAEVVFILLAPTFVNKRFFWTVSISSVIKYLLYGIVLKTSVMIFPILITSIIASISYIILNRFSSYINGLTLVYDELSKKQKLAAIGQMATGIAHEIRNPLTSLKGFLKLQQESGTGNVDYGYIMNQEIDRLHSIVNDLMVLGKPKSVVKDNVDLKKVVDYGLALSEQYAMGKKVQFIKDYDPEPALISGDGNQLKQVILNLVKNSVDAIMDEGYVKLSIQNTGNEIDLLIEDNGYGISEEHLKKLSEPFFTTKQDGTGLGLMVTNQIINEHEGKIEIESNVGKGTKIRIKFPKIHENH